jgi:hypothetical protein
METYQSVGKFKINNNSKEAFVETMLPVLKNGGKYKYLNYYNISNDNYFGLLGILSVDGEPNTDLRKYNSDTIKLTDVQQTSIDLSRLKPINGGNDFSNLKQNDNLYFMCFHDDTFVANNDIFQKFQDSLPDFPFKQSEDEDDRKPKVGNGGILTFEGS